MKSILTLLSMFTVYCLLAFRWPSRSRILKPVSHGLDSTGPQVKILEPQDQKAVGWNSQVRYEISVSDATDGESRYGEINATQTLMEVSYLPAGKGTDIKGKIKDLERRKEPKGLGLMKISTCFGCHGDKTRIAAPAFAELAKKYQSTTTNLKTLGTHIIQGSHGVWGNQEMPAHPDLTLDQAVQMASYMLEEGKNQSRWVYPGLEGVVRVMEKPKNVSQGVYVLTASYTSKSKLRGQHSIVLSIH